MMKTTHYALTSALPAIAAALALSPTQVIAQQVQPTEPAPVTTQSPPPTVDAAPTTTDVPPVTSDTSATAPVSTSTTTNRRTVTRTTRVAVAKPPAPVTRPATRTVTTRTVATRTATAVAAPPAAAPAASTPPARQSEVVPVVDLTAKTSTPPATNAAKPAGSPNRNELVFGAGALALLALAAAAFAMSRRRRHEEEWVDQPTAEFEPVDETPASVEPADEPIVHDEQPAMVAPSAFAWGGQEPAKAAEADSDDDRLPGESWVERAYRGPSPGNPSVSLKNRLRRAAFFDKREREVAAGVAEPVDMDAGLPEAMADEQERQLA
jgi:hypothetical protein